MGKLRTHQGSQAPDCSKSSSLDPLLGHLVCVLLSCSFFSFLQSMQVSDFCFSWLPGTCLDDSWLHPPHLTPSSPKDVQIQLHFAHTQQGDLLPVIHIEWTLQTDGEWACQPGPGGACPPPGESAN